MPLLSCFQKLDFLPPNLAIYLDVQPEVFCRPIVCFILLNCMYCLITVLRFIPICFMLLDICCEPPLELCVCLQLNQRFDHDDQYNIVPILDYLSLENHLCIAFEMLGQSL
jgi:hypothetical protein